MNQKKFENFIFEDKNCPVIRITPFYVNFEWGIIFSNYFLYCEKKILKDIQKFQLPKHFFLQRWGDCGATHDTWRRDDTRLAGSLPAQVEYTTWLRPQLSSSLPQGLVPLPAELCSFQFGFCILHSVVGLQFLFRELGFRWMFRWLSSETIAWSISWYFALLV